MQITDIFGARVFDDSAMRSHMPERVYSSLKETGRLGTPLDPEIADIVAAAMKDWAVSQGATHYSHWFQPLNNFTASKHDAFLSGTENGKAVMEFSSSALIQGEPDASSFPSGGLRNVFEARGYTTWDPTSPAFVRDGTLFIPTAFCSYTGEALDTKTPLLRSTQALVPQARRILKVLGYDSRCAVIPAVGAEQEYFLIDRELYEKRLDLKLCGRTLQGAKPPKGQELDDHYCGRIRLRVADFMRAVDRELWKFGITSKTKHNESAPAQHELAPIYEAANIACDHNLLTMEVLRVTAKRHGLACLLHEKPFEGINGSGKHNNYSIMTDTGINFLSPGNNPGNNYLFLLTLCALIEAADKYADLLRLCTATPGNDARLGGFEAPPPIISVFLGESLTGLLYAAAKGGRAPAENHSHIDMGVDALPILRRDDNDRNRTSPFAFTGNKFEFRMLGSSQSIAMLNTVLNTAVADSFSRFADRLENCADPAAETAHIIAQTLEGHSRVIYNGNNYSEQWRKEAERRGLPVIDNAVDAAAALIHPKNTGLFAAHNVFSQRECHARYEVMLENFSNVRGIEAETLLQMTRRQIYPASIKAAGDTAKAYCKLAKAGMAAPSMRAYLLELTRLSEETAKAAGALSDALESLPGQSELKARAMTFHESVRPAMEKLRQCCDSLEEVMPAEIWPIPVYTELLYRV